MALVIRKAAMEDLEGIVELWQKLSVDQLSKDDYYEGSLEFKGGHDQFTTALADSNCAIFVAELDESVVGFIEVWLYNKDFHFFVDDYAYILHYYIEEASRSDKSAVTMVYRLFKEAEEWAISKGRKYLAADVFNHNQRVIKLLEFVGLGVYRTRMVKKIEPKGKIVEDEE